MKANFFEKWVARIRSPFLLLVNLVFMVLSTTMFTLCSFLKNKKIDDWIIRSWARVLCWTSGIKIELEGEENIPAEGCLILFNHSSLFDIPIMYAAIQKNFRYGAKAELFKVPFLGMTLKTMGALPIHRGQREVVLELYKQSVPRIEQGESFALAPEGTRQEGREIGRFKTGPFIFAVQAQTKVMPVLLIGAEKVLPKKTIFVNQDQLSQKVKVKVLPPVDASQFGEEGIDDLRDLCREKMVDGANNY